MELELEYDEKTGKFSMRKEPYAVVECVTKEDYDELQKAWEYWKKHKEDEANAGSKDDCADGSTGADGTVPMG